MHGGGETGGPGFLPEAGWKPAALPGAWRQQRRGWAGAEPEACREGAPGAWFSLSSTGPCLPGLEALTSEGVRVETCNQSGERDLRPQHTPSRPSPAASHSGTLGLMITHAYIGAHGLTKITGIYSSPYIHTDAKKYVYSHDNTFIPTRHTTLQYSCIPRILYIISLSPTGHTSRFRCVTAMSHSPPCKQAWRKIPSHTRGTRILHKYPTAAGFYTQPDAHERAQAHQFVFSYNCPPSCLHSTDF